MGARSHRLNIYQTGQAATRDCQFRLHVANQNDVSRASGRRPGFHLARIDKWLDENCGAPDGAEKSGVGAASIRRRQAVVPSAGLGPGDLRTKPISMMGTERQQTVQSQVSRVLALREYFWVAYRPPNPLSRCAARPRIRGHVRVDLFADGPRRQIIEAVTSSMGGFNG
jgi:hypothetical protein